MAVITLSGTISIQQNVEQTDKELKSMGFGILKNGDKNFSMSFEDEIASVGISLSEKELKQIIDFLEYNHY